MSTLEKLFALVTNFLAARGRWDLWSGFLIFAAIIAESSDTLEVKPGDK